MAYRFREAREKAGLSTLEVAKRIGVSQPAVTNWDNGTKSPSIDNNRYDNKRDKENAQGL